MITVYVKHYLNQAGREYFQTKWFPYVKDLITKQDGFIDISTKPDDIDKTCINITVKFSSLDTLNIWVDNDLHQEIINDLDPYRVSGQRWFIDQGDSEAPEDIEKWEQAPLPDKQETKKLSL